MLLNSLQLVYVYLLVKNKYITSLSLDTAIIFILAVFCLYLDRDSKGRQEMYAL